MRTIGSGNTRTPLRFSTCRWTDAGPQLRTFAGAREVIRLDEALCEKIKRAWANYGSTFFVTLLAAFEVLLCRLSGQSDFVIGIPIAGQPRLEDGHLVAHCVNTLPLRCRIDLANTFRQTLAVCARGAPRGASTRACDIRQPGAEIATPPRSEPTAPRCGDI